MSLTNEQLLDAIRGLQTEMTKELQSFRIEVNTRFDKVDERFEKVDERFDKVDERFEKVDERFDKVDERFEKVDERFDKVEKKQDVINKHLGKVSEDVTEIKGTIEHHESDIKSLYKRSFDLKEKVESRSER